MFRFDVQLRDNFGALGCAERLTPAIMAAIEEVVQNKLELPKDWNCVTAREQW